MPRVTFARPIRRASASSLPAPVGGVRPGPGSGLLHMISIYIAPQTAYRSEGDLHGIER
jgi:hypothetical protein